MSNNPDIIAPHTLALRRTLQPLSRLPVFITHAKVVELGCAPRVDPNCINCPRAKVLKTKLLHWVKRLLPSC